MRPARHHSHFPQDTPAPDTTRSPTLKPGDVRADRHDLTGELVTEDHRRDGEDRAVIPLGRVGPADRGPGHP